MSESRPYSTATGASLYVEGASVTRVSIDDLARVPAQQLARLLLERAAEDPTLLSRLYETIGPQADLRATDGLGRERPARDRLARERPATEGQAATKAAAAVTAIVGESPAMRRLAVLVRRFDQTDEPVLITGESGTGKELLAHAIHNGSRRAKGPFVALNCAAIPSGLVASELFGYEKGAFTGATSRSLGQIEHANGGTLFLDEIGDMPIDLQGHLLRFLQGGQIRRVGGRETVGLNVRIVAATNVRLAEAITEGRFREDLFYRLNVLTLHVPPLRERPEDIAPLANHFLRVAERDFNRRIEGFSAGAMAALHRYRWPGNVRELMSVIRRAVVVGDGKLIDVPALTGLEDRQAATPCAAKPGSPDERDRLLATLERMSENVTSTADALNVSRVTLYRMLRRHGIVLKRGLAEAPIAVARRAQG
jgi:transcriptional regulator with PAS, ATPase and Fis domain